MLHRHSQAGRALLVILLLVAVAAIGYLLLGDTLFSGGGDGRGDGDGTDPSLLRAGDGTEDPPDLRDGGGLRGRYGEGDLGAVRMRLLEVVSNQPVAAQPVLLVSRTGSERTETTGIGGEVVFDRVAPARGYRVDIVGEGFAPLSLLGVRVKAGETTDLGDIVLGKNVVLRGRVLAREGRRPIPGAEVAVFRPDRSILVEGIFFAMVGQATRFPAPVEKTVTDDDGWFTFTTLQDGTYRLEARHTGFASAYETEVVVARDRSARDLTVLLGDGGRVRGRVRTHDGRPIRGARVIAMVDPGRRFTGGDSLKRDTTETDGGGSYEIDTLTKGVRYRFGVMAEGFAPVFEMGSVEIRDEDVEKDFSLAEGGTLTGTVTRKSDGGPLAGAEVVVLVGRMGGPGGRRGGGRRGGGRNDGGEAAPQNLAAARTSTDAEGRFRVESLLPGPVSAQVKAAGYVTYTAGGPMGAGVGDIVAGEELDVAVELELGGVIEGIVREPGGEPVIGAEVTVLPRGPMMFRAFLDGSPYGTTDLDGRYRLGGLAPGIYGIIARADGYAATDPNGEETEATIPDEGGTVEKDVVLISAGTISGVVRDSSGVPVAGARVQTLSAPEGGGFNFGRLLQSFLPGGTVSDFTDAEGRFLLAGVSTGQKWVLGAEAEDFVPFEGTPFDVGAGETKEIDVVLTGGGNLAGRVVDERGRFVQGARVQVGHLPADQAAAARMSSWQADSNLDPEVFTTDENGKFFIEGIQPGTTLVKVRHEGYVTFYRRNVVIKADETVEDYMVALSRGDVMEGIVRGADGQPLAGAFVAVTADEDPGFGGGDDSENATDVIEPRMSDRTGEDGKFRIENVTPGTYNVVVWGAPGHAGWGGERDESAIRRQVISSAKNVEFRLVASEGGMFPPGRPGR